MTAAPAWDVVAEVAVLTVRKLAKLEMEHRDPVFQTWLAERMEECHPDVLALALAALNPWADDARLNMDRCADRIRAAWLKYRVGQIERGA